METTKYFISLYEQIININEGWLINDKDKHIIQAIAIRIMFDYPLSDNFYDNILSKKKKKVSSTINVIDNDIEGFIDEKGKVIAVNYLLTTDTEMKKFIKLMK